MHEAARPRCNPLRRLSGRRRLKAIVTVMLKHGVLDPQGKAIGHALTAWASPGCSECAPAR